MAIFLSTTVNKVDQKGRVSVPAPFRTALAKENTNVIVVFRSPYSDMLEGCSYEEMEAIAEQLDEYPKNSPEYNALSNVLRGATPLTMDPDGRIVLPKTLMDHANISDSVAFSGVGRTFEMWEPSALDAHMNGVREETRTKGIMLPPRRRVPK